MHHKICHFLSHPLRGGAAVFIGFHACREFVFCVVIFEGGALLSLKIYVLSLPIITVLKWKFLLVYVLVALVWVEVVSISYENRLTPVFIDVFARATVGAWIRLRYRSLCYINQRDIALLEKDLLRALIRELLRMINFTSGLLLSLVTAAGIFIFIGINAFVYKIFDGWILIRLTSRHLNTI